MGLECTHGRAAETEAAEGERTPRVTPQVGEAEVARCLCPQAAEDIHLLSCPLGLEAFDRLVRNAEAAARDSSGRGRRARGGRGRGRTQAAANTAPPEETTQTTSTRRLPAATWCQLDSVTLSDYLHQRVGTFQKVPRAFRGRFRMALLCALERILETQTEERELLEERAWKLWCLLPLMLLRRTQGSNKEGQKELQQRFQKFWRGEWLELIAAGQERARTAAAEDTKEKRARTACHKVRLGEASRAAQTLTAGKLAPGTDATLEELTDPNRRPRDQLERLPDEVANFRADTPLELDTKLFLSVLRAAPRGSSAALTGWRYEHLKVALDNERTAQALAEVATLYAQAKIPGSVAKVLSTGTLTALLKDNGRVRGIVAGDSLRRLVARTLAKQFGPEMKAACAFY